MTRDILKKLESTIGKEKFAQATNRETTNDINEVCSPPRLVARTLHHGLGRRFSQDFIGTILVGEGWNFCFPHMRERAVTEFNDEQPELIIFSPMCGPFSQLQELSYSKMTLEQGEGKLRSALIHFKFPMALCKMQAQRGRLFTFQHFATAKSWIIKMVNEAFRLPGVMVVDFDFCKYGMTSFSPQGQGLEKMMTRIMTNSMKLAKKFFKAQCLNDHEHIPSTNYRAGPCQEYPIAFCDETCMVVKEEFQDKYICEESDDTKKVLLAIAKNERFGHDSVPIRPRNVQPIRMMKRRRFITDIMAKNVMMMYMASR